MTLHFGVGQTELPWGDSGTNGLATNSHVTRIAQEVKELGANSIRMSIMWSQIDPNRNGKYRWANLDYAVNAVRAAGLDILLIIEMRSAPESAAPDFGLLCGAIAQRYGNAIRWFEIGNEVNQLGNFVAPHTPSKYVEFLRPAYTNIMKYVPSAMVFAGALMAIGTGWASLSPIEWTQAFVDSRGQDYCHAVSMHPYMRNGSTYVPQVPAADNWSLKNIVGIRAILDAAGATSTLIACTEWGFDSMTSPSGLAVSAADIEAEQARNVEALWNLLKPFADAGIIYDTTWPFTYRDWEADNKKAGRHYGMVHLDYTPKPERMFFRSLVTSSAVAPPTATASARALPPTVTEFVNPGKVKPSPATAAAAAVAPIVGEKLAVSVATATGQAWPPTIEVLSPSVQLVTLGTGDRDNPAGSGASSSHLDMSIDVTNVRGRLLLVPLVVSTSNLRDWSNYLPDVESSLCGALKRIGSRHIGSTSVLHGSVHWYGFFHPPVGTHAITADVTDAFTGFTDFAGVPLLLKGASGYGTLVAAGSTGAGGNTARVAISSLLDHLTLALFGSNAALPGLNFAALYSDGVTVQGDGDFITVASHAPTAAETVTFEDTTVLRVFGALALDVPNLVSPQDDITTPPATATAQALPPQLTFNGLVAAPPATATAQAIPPSVGEPVPVPPATATAQALTPSVIENSLVAAPPATATAQAMPPIVGEPVTPPAATATAQALVPLVGEPVTAPAATATAQAFPPGLKIFIDFTFSGSTKPSGGVDFGHNLTTSVASGVMKEGNSDVNVDGFYYSAWLYPQAMSTDVYKGTVYSGTNTLASRGCGVAVACNDAATIGVIGIISNANDNVEIWTWDGSVFTQRGPTTDTTRISTGDQVSLKITKSAGIYTFTVQKNGVDTTCAWTDSTAIVGTPSKRWGPAFKHRRSGGVQGASPGVSRVVCADT